MAGSYKNKLSPRVLCASLLENHSIPLRVGPMVKKFFILFLIKVLESLYIQSKKKKNTFLSAVELSGKFLSFFFFF